MTTNGTTTAYDLNDRTTGSGLYTAYKVSNGPNGNPNINAQLRLVYSNDWIVQIFFGIDDPGEFWIRHYYTGNTWSAWKRYASTN